VQFDSGVSLETPEVLGAEPATRQLHLGAEPATRQLHLGAEPAKRVAE
jgi:hypothetical protein